MACGSSLRSLAPLNPPLKGRIWFSGKLSYAPVGCSLYHTPPSASQARQPPSILEGEPSSFLQMQNGLQALPLSGVPFGENRYGSLAERGGGAKRRGRMINCWRMTKPLSDGNESRAHTDENQSRAGGITTASNNFDEVFNNFDGVIHNFDEIIQRTQPYHHVRPTSAAAGWA